MYAETEAQSNCELRNTNSTICLIFGRIGLLVQLVSAIISSFQHEWWAAFALLIAGTLFAILFIQIFYPFMRDWFGGKYSETNPLVALDNDDHYAASGRRHIINVSKVAILALTTSMLIAQF
jgi:putative Mn2+ efflux pump MntP